MPSMAIATSPDELEFDNLNRLADFSHFMAWTTRQYSREEINAAGRQFAELEATDPTRDKALEIINNWRSCHGYPLQAVKMTLLNRAKGKISTTALVAQRIKRLPSIALKLKHNPDMKLSQMQDIGGCRAVLNTSGDVEKLVRVYEEALAKNPHRKDRALLVKKDDYIAEPKPDGYRGVHLIMKYYSAWSPEFNEQKIEIQVRSKLQHAWATAVETCQTFTGQALKSKIKSASDTWLRFFALMSSAISVREKRPPVPNTPLTKAERVAEIKGSIAREKQVK